MPKCHDTHSHVCYYPQGYVHTHAQTDMHKLKTGHTWLIARYVDIHTDTDTHKHIHTKAKPVAAILTDTLTQLNWQVAVNIMLNKNSLAVKKVRGQSEATMAISDQNL